MTTTEPQDDRLTQPRLLRRTEDGLELPFLVWQFEPPLLALSSASIGGGHGLRRSVINAEVASGYSRFDIDAHLGELAALAGHAGVVEPVASAGSLIGMLTAADVSAVQHGAEDGAEVWATVGIGVPTWAAAIDDASDPVPVGGWAAPGTINIVVLVPETIDPGAMVNLVATVTEAKAQAFSALEVPGTGTATDSVTVLCPDAAAGVVPAPGAVDDARRRFGGPRSYWGARIARVVFEAVRLGGLDSLERQGLR